MMSSALSFDPAGHVYTVAGRVLPSITQLLTRSGWIDPQWYTEASRVRGTAVHTLTAAYDLDALDLATVVSPYRGWLLAHVHAMRVIRPGWLKVEQINAHQALGFAGKPDRVGRVWGAYAVVELKSGEETKAHPLQTALQAMLEASDLSLPPEALARYAVYLTEAGRFRVIEHKDSHDFTKARKILREHA